LPQLAGPLPVERSIAHGVLDRPVEPGDDTVGLYAAAKRFAFTATRFVALPVRQQKREARLAELTLRPRFRGGSNWRAPATRASAIRRNPCR
jgi:hypothetical protein